jgi:hypothetical protein
MNNFTPFRSREREKRITIGGRGGAVRDAVRVFQYSETNVMHFLFSLLRIKDLYMFRALLAHPQEILH